MQKERDTTIDIAKGLGIILVVACHANFAPVSPGRFFHMPLFFFLTGYLSSFQDGFGTLLYKKIRTLYLPFIFVELLYVATNPLYVTMGISQASNLSISAQLAHIVCFDNVALILSPIWFLAALFFVNILCWILVHWWRMSRCRWLPVFVSITLCAIGMANTHLGWLHMTYSCNFKEIINVVLVAQLFCILGFLVKNWRIEINNMWIALIAFIYLYVSKLWLGLSVDMRANQYSSVMLFLLAALGGIYMILFISKKINSWQHPLGRGIAFLCQLMGKASLYILILHIFCFKIVGFLQENIGHLEIQNSGWENPGCYGAWTLVYILIGLGLPTCIYLLAHLRQHVQD